MRTPLQKQALLITMTAEMECAMVSLDMGLQKEISFASAIAGATQCLRRAEVACQALVDKPVETVEK